MSFVGNAPSATQPDMRQQQTNVRTAYNIDRAKNNPAINKQQVGAFQGGLQTEFHGSSGGVDLGYDVNDYGATQNDTDVMNLQRLVNDDYSGTHGNQGVDFGANSAQENVLRSRIGMKNSLAEQIAGSGDQLSKAQDINKATAGSALDQGLKNTRQNYSGRGLLYSGMRQGAEQGVKAGVASQLSSAMTGTARDAANSKMAAQNAYASVDLASQQENLTRANQAFDTASANNIARLQAMQQLGSGLGSAAGSLYGDYQAYQDKQAKAKAGLIAGDQNQSVVG